METVKKIRILLVLRDIAQAKLARKLNPPLSPQNLNNKMRHADMRESELRAIAEGLNCDLKIEFVMRDTGEVI